MSEQAKFIILGDEKPLVAATKRGEKAFDSLGNHAEKAGKKSQAAFHKGGKSGGVLGGLFGGGISDRASIGSRGGSFGIGGFGIGAIAIGGAASMAVLGTSVVKTTAKFEGFRNQLNYAAGSALQGGRDFQYIKDKSSELGLDLASTTDAFAKLAAATKGTSLAGQTTKDIFEGISYAGTALHLSAEQVSRSLYAVQQMASKGKVSSEELRQQLGDSLPGALQIAADSMGITTRQFTKLLDEGKIVSEDFLPKFAKQLIKRFAEPAKIASTSIQASLNRISTGWDLLNVKIGEASMGPMKKGLVLISGSLEKMGYFVDLVALNWGKLREAVSPVVNVAKGLYSIFSDIGSELFGNASGADLFESSIRRVGGVLKFYEPLFQSYVKFFQSIGTYAKAAFTVLSVFERPIVAVLTSIRDVVSNMVTSIADIIGGLGKVVIGIAHGDIKAIGQGLESVAKGAVRGTVLNPFLAAKGGYDGFSKGFSAFDSGVKLDRPGAPSPAKGGTDTTKKKGVSADTTKSSDLSGTIKGSGPQNLYITINGGLIKQIQYMQGQGISMTKKQFEQAAVEGLLSALNQYDRYAQSLT